jgi:hypothetical protein
MPSPEINEVTRREWRELGFFYDRDDVAKEWRLLGSKAGLRLFAANLKRYVDDRRNELISEHEHFGPYMYLKVGTWASPEITDDWIAGPLPVLQQLALAIDAWLETAAIGERLSVRSKFAASSPYEFTLEMYADSFDPAVADPCCW